MKDEIMLGFEVGIVKELYKLEMITEQQMKTAIKILTEQKERRGSKSKE